MVVARVAGEHAPPRRGIQAIALGDAAREPAWSRSSARCASARPQPTFADWQDRKLTAHFKIADRNNARWALILGDDELAAGELVLRDLAARADRRLPLVARRGGGRARPCRSDRVMEQDEAARVRALGEIAAEFDLDAIRVRTGDTEIEIVRRDPAAAAPVGRVRRAARRRAGAAGAPPRPRRAPRPRGPAAGERPQGHRAGRRRVLPRGVAGRRPVRRGRQPRAGRATTLCILEAMKLMNEINSDYAGVVVRRPGGERRAGLARSGAVLDRTVSRRPARLRRAARRPQRPARRAALRAAGRGDRGRDGRRRSATATRCCGSATAAAPPTRSTSPRSSAAAFCASAKACRRKR